MMNENERHQLEAVSGALLQSFVDPEGGFPLDSPMVQRRQQQKRGRLADVTRRVSILDRILTTLASVMIVTLATGMGWALPWILFRPDDEDPSVWQFAMILSTPCGIIGFCVGLIFVCFIASKWSGVEKNRQTPERNF
jgi:hypothetical protein